MVPTNPSHTPIQRFRLDLTVWVKLGHAAKAAGTNRSQLLGEFARWYVRERGARMPERPEVPIGGWPTTDA